MKKYFLFFILIKLCCLSFGQTAGKIGGVNDNAINKIGSVPISAIGKAGNVTVQVYFKNCKEIKQNNPAAADGVYTIDPDGSGTIAPFNCFCDMTTDGGGWTMVGNYRFPANYENFMYAKSDAAYGTAIAEPNGFSPWTDWRVLSGITWPVEFAVTLSLIPGDQTPYSTWGALNSKVIYRVKNRDVMPNYGTAQDLVTDDNLYYKFYFSDGWTDVGSASISAWYYWYPYDAAGNFLICFHYTSNYTAYYGAGVPGGDSMWQHSARMFVR